MKRGIAYVLFSNWRTGDSGVDTFVRHIEPLFRDGRVSGELVETPYKEVDCRASESLNASPKTRDAVHKPGKPGSWRLLVGYMRRVLHDVHVLWPLREKLKGRVLVTNQFGCEPLPLALRMLSPMGRVVAICHTHAPRCDQDHHDGVRRLVERLVYRSVDRVIYNSNSVREEWRQRMGLKRIEGDVIWYGIDPPDEMLPADYPEKPGGAVDFVCVSRFVHWKGHKELITAFAQAVNQLLDTRHPTPNAASPNTAPPSLRLILVGNGPTWQECIDHSRNLSLHTYVSSPPHRPAPNSPADVPSSRNGPAVFFLGCRPNGAAYFNGADVGVQLSTEPEAFGIVLLEAMSRGKPVLGSRMGGIPEAVVDGETGILVDPANGVDVAAAICRLADDPDLRNTMGAAGHARWKLEFTVDRMLSDYRQYLLDVCSDGNLSRSHSL